jgi:hypothetical protein
VNILSALKNLSDERLLSLDRTARMAAQPQRRPLRIARNTKALSWNSKER